MAEGLRSMAEQERRPEVAAEGTSHHALRKMVVEGQALAVLKATGTLEEPMSLLQVLTSFRRAEPMCFGEKKAHMQ